MRKAFTAKLLDLPPRPKSGAAIYFDPKNAGLCLRVPADGSVWFYFIGRNDQKKECRIRLAAWSPHGGIGLSGEKLDLDAIRDLAKVARANLRAGRDPYWTPGQPETKAPTITLVAALELHLASRPLGKLTMRSYRQHVDCHLSDWKARPLAEISRAETFERHARITKENGKCAANGTMRVFRAVFNRARRQHPELPECPSANVDFHRIKPRDFGLRPDGIAALYKAISELGDEVKRDYLLLLLYTGVRRRSAACIEIEHVDLKKGVLHIAIAKGGEDRAYDVPITRQLRAILKRRIEHAQAKKSKWIFPGRNKEGRFEYPYGKGLPPPQAFRKLFASVASLIVGAYPLKRLLNHASNTSDVTEHYLHLGTKELLPAAQMVADRIEALAQSKEPVAEAEFAVAAE